MTSQLVAYDLQRQTALLPNESTSSSSSETGCGRVSIRHILVPLDGSAMAECVLPFVTAVAKAFAARVTVLRVLESGDTAPTDAVEWEIARAEAYARLAQHEAALRAQGVTASVEIVQGRAAEQLPHFAKTHGAELIILSTHGVGGLNSWKLGGTVQKIIAITHASVLIVPAQRPVGDPPRFRKMLVPLDCSQRAECILPAATELARAHNAELILAHVVPEPEIPRRMPPSNEDIDLTEKVTERNRREGQRYLLAMQKRLAATTVRVEARLVVCPRPVQALQDLAKDEQVDLVILSAHGGTGDAREHYGSVAAKFLQEGSEPVIILQDLEVIDATSAPDTLGQERQAH